VRRETKIDCLIFSLAVVFAFSSFYARYQLDARFQDMIGKNEKVKNGPLESIFLDLVREQQQDREAIEKEAEEKKKATAKKPAKKPAKKKSTPRKKKPKKKPPPKKAVPKKSEEELKAEAEKKPKPVDGL